MNTELIKLRQLMSQDWILENNFKVKIFRDETIIVLVKAGNGFIKLYLEKNEDFQDLIAEYHRVGFLTKFKVSKYIDQNEIKLITLLNNLYSTNIDELFKDSDSTEYSIYNIGDVIKESWTKLVYKFNS